MGRPQKPIDPGEGPLARFAVDLRELRSKAGNPPYRAMAKRAHTSASTLAAAASGGSLPTLPVTLAYVEACGGDVAEWRARWLALRGELDLKPVEPLPAAAVPEGTWRSPRRRITVGALGAVTALGAVIIVITSLSAGSPRPSGTATDRISPKAVQPTHPGLSTATAGSAPTAAALIAGANCVTTPAHIFSDYDAPGADGWHHIGGGWREDGCHGFAEYTHITGIADTWAQTADWIFQTPIGHRCMVAVYIPDIVESAGLAHYDVYGSTDTTYDSRLATFVVEQSLHHGQWVTAGPYLFSRSIADIEITDRGTSHATIVLSAASLTCS